jgi:hypothetical protein
MSTCCKLKQLVRNSKMSEQPSRKKIGRAYTNLLKLKSEETDSRMEVIVSQIKTQTDQNKSVIMKKKITKKRTLQKCGMSNHITEKCNGTCFAVCYNCRQRRHLATVCREPEN